MLVGDFIRNQEDGLSQTKKCGYLALSGILFFVTGILWNFVFPINKKLYSSSFACFVAGLGILAFTLMYYIIDIKGISKWATFLRVIGFNSLAIYMAYRIVDFRYTSKFLFGSVISLFPSNWAELLIELGSLIISWLLLYFLYKKKICIKI